MGACFSKKKKFYTIISYNIYSLGQYFNNRINGIINAITDNEKHFPEIICLQETNINFIQNFINKAKKNNIHYYCYSTKTYYENNKLLSNYEKVELNNDLEKYGYIAILSIWEIYDENKIYSNFEWLYNGIIKVKLKSNKDINEDIILYNIHAIKPNINYNKNKNNFNYKYLQYIEEFKILESNILEEYNNNKNNLIYICGDFNINLNDKTTLEYNHSPPQFNPNFIDCWEYLNINNNTLINLGFTEDEETNQYKASIDIKSNFEKRTRFNGIFIYTTNIKLPIKSIKIIGNEKLDIKKNINGKGEDKYNFDCITYTNLFPSIHYGIELKCIKNNI